MSQEAEETMEKKAKVLVEMTFEELKNCKNFVSCAVVLTDFDANRDAYRMLMESDFSRLKTEYDFGVEENVHTALRYAILSRYVVVELRIVDEKGIF
jgi:hypothetical protein